jgi:hypothetical protein
MLRFEKSHSCLTIDRQRKKLRTIDFERFVTLSDKIFFIAYWHEIVEKSEKCEEWKEWYDHCHRHYRRHKRRSTQTIQKKKSHRTRSKQDNCTDRSSFYLLFLLVINIFVVVQSAHFDHISLSSCLKRISHRLLLLNLLRSRNQDEWWLCLALRLLKLRSLMRSTLSIFWIAMRIYVITFVSRMRKKLDVFLDTATFSLIS